VGTPLGFKKKGSLPMIAELPSLARMTAQQGPTSFGSGHDRRGHARVGFDCPVRWCKDGTDRFGWARDASESGAGFTVPTSAAPQIGEEIAVVFRLDNYCDWEICDRARVVWRDDASSGTSHIGVRRSCITQDTHTRHRHLFHWA
jgi:hypothetical protein